MLESDQSNIQRQFTTPNCLSCHSGGHAPNSPEAIPAALILQICVVCTCLHSKLDMMVPCFAKALLSKRQKLVRPKKPGFSKAHLASKVAVDTAHTLCIFVVKLCESIVNLVNLVRLFGDLCAIEFQPSLFPPQWFCHKGPKGWILQDWLILQHLPLDNHGQSSED